MLYLWYFCYQLTPHILIIRAASCLLIFHWMDFTGLLNPAVPRWDTNSLKAAQQLAFPLRSWVYCEHPTSLPHLSRHFWNGRAVCSVAAAGWLASQFPVGRLSRRLVQKRASPELPSLACIQGGLIYTTPTSLYPQQCNVIFKTWTFTRLMKKNLTES